MWQTACLFSVLYGIYFSKDGVTEVVVVFFDNRNSSRA